MKKIKKPNETEYPAYAAMYINLVTDDGQVLTHLQSSFKEVKEFILSLLEEKLQYRYAEDKWSIKEILVHIIDDERIYTYRALCFARNDQTELPGFEQDDYTRYSGANERALENIFEEYEAVRKSTVALFNGLTDDALMRSGIANENRSTVRALAYHIAGHELHHIKIIRERYL